MASAQDLAADGSVIGPRILILGYPGSAKTGSLAALVDAGYRLRIMAFDKVRSVVDPLTAFVKDRSKLVNVDIVGLEDKLRGGAKQFETVGKPEAFSKAFALTDNWRYTDPLTGEEIDLGPVKDWTPQDILVVDSITAMGEASMRRRLFMSNRIGKTKRKNDWGGAMDDQKAFIEKACSNYQKCGVIMISHLKLIGPKDDEEDDTDTVKSNKSEIAQVVPFKLFPSALGRALPPEIGQFFPVTVLCTTRSRGGKNVDRIIEVEPRMDVDLKLPALGVKNGLPVDSGMLTIFKALGSVPPA